MLRNLFPLVLVMSLAVPSAALAEKEGHAGGFVVRFTGPAAEPAPAGFVLTLPDMQEVESEAAAPVLEIQPFCCDEKHFWIAASELVMLQVIPWYFNRHVADDPTAVLSFDSWHDNLQQGFEWDSNDFKTNMFMHPFHGSLYFNAARSNGYNYWEAAAFSWVGSMLWEMFGENNRGAINDWAATSMGGMAIGEAFHRAAKAIRDNTATGAERGGREFASFLIDPVGGINRLFRGEASRVGPNPEDRLPGDSRAVLRLGARSIGSDEEKKGYGFFDADIYYGDVLKKNKEPFDSFQIRVGLIQGEQNTLSRLQIEGVLLASRFKDEEKEKHLFALTQHYDYYNTATFEFGGQSLSTSFHSLVPLSDRWSFYGVAQPTASLIWGVSSDYESIFKPHSVSGAGSGSAGGSGSDDFIVRNYDFGSGAGFRGRAYLRRDRTDILELYYLFNWSHTLNGAAGNHLLQYFGARAQVPIFRKFGIGADYIIGSKNSFYRDYPDVKTSDWQLRLFLGVF